MSLSSAFSHKERRSARRPSQIDCIRGPFKRRSMFSVSLWGVSDNTRADPSALLRLAGVVGVDAVAPAVRVWGCTCSLHLPSRSDVYRAASTPLVTCSATPAPHGRAGCCPPHRLTLPRTTQANGHVGGPHWGADARPPTRPSVPKAGVWPRRDHWPAARWPSRAAPGTRGTYRWWRSVCGGGRRMRSTRPRSRGDASVDEGDGRLVAGWGATERRPARRHHRHGCDADGHGGAGGFVRGPLAKQQAGEGGGWSGPVATRPAWVRPAERTGGGGDGRGGSPLWPGGCTGSDPSGGVGKAMRARARRARSAIRRNTDEPASAFFAIFFFGARVRPLENGYPGSRRYPQRDKGPGRPAARPRRSPCHCGAATAVWCRQRRRPRWPRRPASGRRGHPRRSVPAPARRAHRRRRGWRARARAAGAGRTALTTQAGAPVVTPG